MLVVATRNFNLGRGAHATVGTLYEMPDFIAQARINCGHVRAATTDERAMYLDLGMPVEVLEAVAAPLSGFEVQDPKAIYRDPQRGRRGRGR